jgi:hypothetical protein
MADKDNTSNAINIERELTSIIAEKLKLGKEDAAIAKAMKSLHTSINKELKKENENKVESNNLTKKIHNSQVEINKLVAEYSGLGAVAKDAARLAIAQKIRDITAATKKLEKERLKIESQEYMQNLAMQLLNKTGLEQSIKLAGEFNDALSKGGPWAVFGKAMLYALEIFTKLDEESARFRMTMGITRKYMDTIQQDSRDIAFNFAHVGVNAEKVIDAALSLSKTLFSTMSATKSLVTDIALMSAQLGVSAEVSSEFMKNMGMVGRTTAAAKADMIFFTAALTEAAGVPLKDIMEDVSNAAKNSYQFISRSSLALIKASVEAKRMGTSLTSAVASSASLLNFTESVKNEMEASVLLGKGLNLQKARELAYNRDIKGLNNEILKLMHDANFEQLDPFQQDAVARALGKSAGELANMAQAERERLGWERSTDPIVQSQLAAYKEMMNATESIAKEMGKNERQQLMIKQNQAAITSITQSWNAILQRIGEGVLPIIEKTLRYIAIGVGYINVYIGKFNELWQKGGDIMGGIGKTISGVLVVIGLLLSSRYLGRLVGWVGGGIGKGIGSFFSGIAKGIGKLGGTDILKGALGIAALGVSLFIFAKAITAFAVVEWAAVWIGLGALAAFAVVAGIMGAFAPEILLGALAIGVLGLALLPFAAAAWIASKALQNLSDVPLLKIAGGLIAIGLAAPIIALGSMALGVAAGGLVAFALALQLVRSNRIERVANVMNSLGTGIKSVAEGMISLQGLNFSQTISQINNLSKAIIELNKAINEMPDIKVEKLKSLVLPQAGGAAAEGGNNSDTGGILAAIKDGIDGLRSDMKNGSLTANVYIDSQKLDQAMGRRLAYTGTLSS